MHWPVVLAGLVLTLGVVGWIVMGVAGSKKRAAPLELARSVPLPPPVVPVSPPPTWTIHPLGDVPTTKAPPAPKAAPVAPRAAPRPPARIPAPVAQNRPRPPQKKAVLVARKPAPVVPVSPCGGPRPVLPGFLAKGGLPPAHETVCHASEGTFGTQVHFVDNPLKAAQEALKEQKLLLVLHVAGNFEDSKFT